MLASLRAPVARMLGLKTAMIDGIKVSADPDEDVLTPIRNQLHKRTYEAPERALLAQLLTPHDRVLDIGACTGLTALLSARVVGDKNVLAYEANTSLEPLIRRNFALNDMYPELRMRAITVDGGPVSFYLHRNLFSSSAVERPDTAKSSVASDALDKVITEFRPTLVCMDVEGAEVDLLSSSDLPGVRKLLLETHPHIVGVPAVQQITARLAEIGFTRIDLNSNNFSCYRD